LLRDYAVSPAAVRNRLSAMVDAIIARDGYLLTPQMRREMQDYIVDEMLGLGPIQPLLRDEDVEEVMVNRPDEIWEARRDPETGKVKLRRTALTFDDADHVLKVVERILRRLGRRVDVSTPYVDARLPDGSRVNVVIPPVALDGPCITIRKFPEKMFTMEDLVERFGTLTPEADTFLRTCVHGRLNLVVSGGTGSGKTTLLNALSDYITPDERIVTIEDTAELQVHRHKPHVLRLEHRAPNVEGQGEVTIKELVKNALRMRPDRIIVGECRAEETIDMLQAMNTGHDGSLTTVHANSPEEAVFRLETMFLQAGVEMPVSAIRQQIALAIQIVVQLRRMQDGSRKVVEIVENLGIANGQVQQHPLFRLRDGTLVYTGERLKSMSRLLLSGIPIPPLPIFARSTEQTELPPR
jgi:pilus assembly protein CpaF